MQNLQLTVQLQSWYAVYLTSICALQSSKAQSSPFGIGSGHNYQTDPASYSPLSSPATSSPSGNAYSGLTNRSTAFGEPYLSFYILISYWVIYCNIPPVWFRVDDIHVLWKSLCVCVCSVYQHNLMSTDTEEQHTYSTSAVLLKILWGRA